MLVCFSFNEYDNLTLWNETANGRVRLLTKYALERSGQCTTCRKKQADKQASFFTKEKYMAAQGWDAGAGALIRNADSLFQQILYSEKECPEKAWRKELDWTEKKWKSIGNNDGGGVLSRSETSFFKQL